MRYRPEHKDRTRERILKAAGRLFRLRGYDGVGIDAIMAAAKLTRGGFYGYFRSKSDLFAQVMAGPHGFNRMMADRSGRSQPELAREALAIVSDYLDPAHREIVGRGCTMAALSADAARAEAPVKAAFAEKLDALVAEFARSIPAAEERDPRALSAVALCVGGIVLARAAGDATLSDALLAACRDAVAEKLQTGPPVSRARDRGEAR
jgi:TetR/AcrR family transcriptional repressor of nem operon